MRAVSFKSLIAYGAVFMLTLVVGASLVRLASPAKGPGFEFGRGHRESDRRMQFELEQMRQLNEELQQRLEQLEEKMASDVESFDAPASSNVPPLAPVSPMAPGTLPGGDSKDVAPAVPKLNTKARDKASF